MYLKDINLSRNIEFLKIPNSFLKDGICSLILDKDNNTLYTIHATSWILNKSIGKNGIFNINYFIGV